MVFSKLSWAALGFGALGFLGCGGADFEPTAQTEETADESQELTAGTTNPPPVKSFLSLGDSIAFGYNPLIMPPVTPTPPASPSAFVGYPEVIALKGHKVTNASCPGETSGSFLEADPARAPDTGCRNFKAALALHADYETTQIAFVVARIKAQAAKTPVKFDDYITLNLGANDLFILQGACQNDPTCIANGLPGVVAAYSANLDNGYNQVTAAKYKGKFVGVTTYAINYNDQQAVGALTLMNNALRAFTQSTKVKGVVVEAFDAFKTESAKNGAGGDACKAGLLIKKPDNTCDIHPSEKGRKILGNAVLKALGLPTVP